MQYTLLNLSNYDYGWEKTLDWNKGKKSGSNVSQALKNNQNYE